MKKIIFTILVASLVCVSGVLAADTLWEYYQGNLPSISDRAPIYANIADDAYKGLYEQNIALLDYLQSEPEVKPEEPITFDFWSIFERFGMESDAIGGNVPASAVNWTLSTPLSSSATTIDVSDFEDLRGNDIATTSMPTKVYLVIEPQSSSNAEIVLCLSANGDETNTQFTSCTRGLAFYGTSETAVTANKKAHPSGASVIMTNVGQFFNNFVDTDSAQTVAGVKTFSSFPLLPSTDPTTGYQATHKSYVDNSVNQGAATGTETVQGIWEGASQAEMSAGTETGSSGNLALQAKYATSTGETATTSIVVTGTDGKINANFLDDGSYSIGMVGEIIAYASSTVPTGWLSLTGQTVSQTTYSSLYSVIGDTFGASSTALTFNLPDMRGRFITMASTTMDIFNSYGEIGGSASSTLTIDQIPAHTHTTEASGSSQTSGAGIGAPTDTHGNTGSAGGGKDHSIINPYIVMQYIIKY